MKISAKPLQLRPRERLKLQGECNLSTEELLAVVLSSGIHGKNVLELSREIIKKFGDALLATPIHELCRIKGLGQTKALKLKAALEIGLRYANKDSSQISIHSSKDAYVLLHEYTDKKQEHLLLITLNGRNNLISKKIITIGTIDASLFHPREIFAESIIDRAAKIIVAHNHPSGNLSPSQNDLFMTNRIKKSGKLLGIQLVDSLIISKNGYRSIINKVDMDAGENRDDRQSHDNDHVNPHNED